MLTYNRAHELFDYYLDTGILSWKEGTFAFSRQKNGHAGTFNGKGYRIVKADGYWYMVHRVVWLMCYEEWPTNQIDHKDRDRRNNKIANLRDTTGSLNCHNQSTCVNNTSGHPGIELRDSGRYRASICIERRTLSLGTFDTLEEAIEAYDEIKSILRPERLAA